MPHATLFQCLLEQDAPDRSFLFSPLLPPSNMYACIFKHYKKDQDSQWGTVEDPEHGAPAPCLLPFRSLYLGYGSLVARPPPPVLSSLCLLSSSSSLLLPLISSPLLLYPPFSSSSVSPLIPFFFLLFSSSPLPPCSPLLSCDPFPLVSSLLSCSLFLSYIASYSLRFSYSPPLPFPLLPLFFLTPLPPAPPLLSFLHLSSSLSSATSLLIAPVVSSLPFPPLPPPLLPLPLLLWSHLLSLLL